MSKSLNKIIRWGIIGCGSVSHRFMQGLQEIPDAQMAATWSRSPESVKSFVDKYGGKTCSNIDELLASDIDAIYIATLPDSHAFYSIAALKAGKHVLCEKPASINLINLEEVLKVAKEQNLLFMEGMKPPFYPLYRKIKEHLLTDPIGEIGYLRAGSSVTDIKEGHPSLSHELAGGSIMAIGIYEAFLAVDWLGDTKQVQAMGRLGSTAVDMFSIFQTEHEGGYGQFYTGFDLHGKGDALICGTLGNITIHKNWWNPALATIDYRDGRIVELDIPFAAGGFNYEIEHFCQLINNNILESPVINHDMSRQMIAMLDKVRAHVGLRFNGE
ncbi:Predicted dehydrogenase [Pedobacter nyackensis]|uniref:Predicted dehydrogenase n=2 Tax=Pedobacter nyackensis TaxID=475255 RepID=A0A1W2EMD8_9SPHI|nr:Predicted dehydrogenase [Pedobacter nyackensis]